MRGADRGELTHELGSLLRKLQDKRSVRNQQGLFYLEGVSPFLHACAADYALTTVIWSPILLRSSCAQKLVRMQKRRGVRVVKTSPEVFRRFSRLGRASGVAAIGRQRWRSLAEIDPRAGLCWIVLERIRSPGNLGTIMRTAEAVGAAGLILIGSVDPYELAAIRGGMGALFHLELVRTTREVFAAWARERGVQVVGTSPGARTLYCDMAIRRPTALLLGDERVGLSDQALALCEERIHLPILGRGDSLNVAVAAGVVLYDLLRRSGDCGSRGLA